MEESKAAPTVSFKGEKKEKKKVDWTVSFS